MNIAYNTNGAPKSYIAYNGVVPTGHSTNANLVTEGTWAAPNIPTWTTPVAPTVANVEWAYTKSVTAPTGATDNTKHGDGYGKLFQA